MKQIIFILFCVFLWYSCHDMKVGYLETENARYQPDTMLIPITPDPFMDMMRIRNKTPWVSIKIQGVSGTPPLLYSIESVKSEDAGEAAAEIFKNELSIRGGGAMTYPLESNVIPGRYLVSVRISSPDHTEVVEDAFTFVVVEKR